MPDTRVSTNIRAHFTLQQTLINRLAQPTEEQTHPKETSKATIHFQLPRSLRLSETKPFNSVTVHSPGPNQTESNETKLQQMPPIRFQFTTSSTWMAYAVGRTRRRVQQRSRCRANVQLASFSHSEHLRPRSRCIKLDSGDSERRLLDATRGRPEAHQESEAHSAGHCLR